MTLLLYFTFLGLLTQTSATFLGWPIKLLDGWVGWDNTYALFFKVVILFLYFNLFFIF